MPTACSLFVVCPGSAIPSGHAAVSVAPGVAGGWLWSSSPRRPEGLSGALQQRPALGRRRLCRKEGAGRAGRAYRRPPMAGSLDVWAGSVAAGQQLTEGGHLSCRELKDLARPHTLDLSEGPTGTSEARAPPGRTLSPSVDGAEPREGSYGTQLSGKRGTSGTRVPVLQLSGDGGLASPQS